MPNSFVIETAMPENSMEIAAMVGDLLNEIMTATGVSAFNFHLRDTATRLDEFLRLEKYFGFVARSGDRQALGFITLHQSCALYAEGVFGTIPEFYVAPQHRSKGVGVRLLDQAKAFAAGRGWTRLEVTTPPLPQFEQTLAFYEREGFDLAGGRKLKFSL